MRLWALVLICACSGASAPAPKPVDWDLGWLPAATRMVTTASRGVTLTMVGKLPEPCIAPIVQAMQVEVAVITPVTGKAAFGYYGDYDRAAIEACAKKIPIVASVEAHGDRTTLVSDKGARVELWFVSPRWIAAGTPDELAELRTGDRLAVDSTIGKLYAGLGDCTSGCTVTTYPIAERLIGVPSIGATFTTTVPKVSVVLAYASAEDAARARDRLVGKQLSPLVPPRIADALAVSPMQVTGTNVAVTIEIGKPPWSAFSVDDLVAFTRDLQARLASDPAFPGLQPRP